MRSALREDTQPWYKEPWPWILMAGPAIVVVAGFTTFYLAQKNAADLVSDDYYKDGKHIDIELKRDEAAIERKISSQVLISPSLDSAKIFVSGRFDHQAPLRLVLLHPAKKAYDQEVALTPAQGGILSGDKVEYNAVFKPLPQAQHWYVRLEDVGGQWRVEDKWIVSQGNAIDLTPMYKLLGNPQKP